MLRTLRIAAQIVAKVGFVGIVQIAEESSPVAIVAQYLCKGFVRVVREVVSGRIAFLVAVFVAIVQLQEQAHLSESTRLVTPEWASLPLSVSCSLRILFGLNCQQRFCIGKSQRVA